MSASSTVSDVTMDDLVQAMQDVTDLENEDQDRGLQEIATGTDAETLTEAMEAVEKH